jgi:hypothetical protein
MARQYAARVEWTTLLATLLGAAIALGSSVLVEALRRRHDTEWRRIRREVYVAFLSGVSQTRSRLLALSQETGTSRAEIGEKARQTFEPCYELRHQLELFAAPEVLDPALDYFRCVRDVRDIVRAGNGLSDEQWTAHNDRMSAAVKALREVMRDDLRSPALRRERASRIPRPRSRPTLPPEASAPPPAPRLPAEPHHAPEQEQD